MTPALDPDAPRNLRYTLDDSITEHQIQLSWDPPVNAMDSADVEYVVQWRSGSQDFDDARRSLTVTEPDGLSWPGYQ